MSTFDGTVAEMPGIAVDRFDGENLNAAAYFLTHSHTDHTRGLNGDFFQRLKDTGRRLYCTRLTKLFLVRKYDVRDDASGCIVETTPCAPRVLDYRWKGQKQVLTVNCVSAGHSPGSVMFIFENGATRVLCTGDFRIDPADLPKIKALNLKHAALTVPLRFDKIYLDTTFLNPEYAEFPSRSQSLDIICTKAAEWIGLSAKNIVSLECAALTGSEFIFMELTQKTGKAIHVKENIYEEYSRMERLSRCVTLDPRATPLHACVKKQFAKDDRLPCRTKVERANILTIVVSAYRWRNREPPNTFSEWDARRKNRLYVCCSMHPSYNELKAFLCYFKPSNVHPCVDPPANSQISAAELLRELRQEERRSEPETRVDYDLMSLIGKPSATKRKPDARYLSDDSSD